jgi:hypothetical protein
MLDGKETKTKPSMCGKFKPVLMERGLELLRQKSSRLTCFFCHPQIVLAEVFKTTRENNRDKTMMVPRLHGKKNYVREKTMQCNQT